ncbi:MAG: hypothetical protein JWM32_3137 [Verrucomicrobia bacterium]|nr:hypothetical protein [Verrucomicrobiota bacterium]
MQAKITEAEKQQTIMRVANRIVRNAKLGDEVKIVQIAAACDMHHETARRLLVPDDLGRTGFPAYELTNNAANIRRLQKRLAEVTREKSRSSVTVRFPGGRMEDHAEDARIRIYHEAKPERPVIEALKGNGFHWTPSLQCWQRLRNEGARWAAERVTGVKWPRDENPGATAATESPRGVPRI